MQEGCLLVERIDALVGHLWGWCGVLWESECLLVFDCGVVGGYGLGLWVSYDCFGSLGGVYIFLRVIVGNDGLGRGLMRLYGM